MSIGMRTINASFGIDITDHSKITFMELKKKKAYCYVIKINEKQNKVLVDKTGDPKESYDDFALSLPEDDCRHAVYDFDFVTCDNCRKSKIFFIAWVPEISGVREKMLYATSKAVVKRDLDGVHYDVQATEAGEMDLEVIRSRAR